MTLICLSNQITSAVKISITIILLLTRSINPLDLPVLPNPETIAAAILQLNGPYAGASTVEKRGLIPKQFWVTVKDKKEFKEKARFLEKHRSWEFRLVDDYDMDTFMTTAFNGTSVLWAYKLLNRKIGAARWGRDLLQ
jgi:hypothetical protein